MSTNNEILDIQEAMFAENKGALAKYQELVVGKKGFWNLVRYELFQMFVAGMPGAAGLALRRLLYPALLGRVGRNVVFGAHVVIRHPHKVFIGDNVVIDDHCLLDAKGSTNQGIVIGSGVFIGRNSILHCKNGDIRIGDHVNIGFNSDIASSNLVEIGEKVLIAAYAYIVGGGHDYSQADVAIQDQARTALGIRVGANGWIGAGATLLDGVDIGPGSIIGTGAVVTESIPAGSVAAGVPARVIRRRAADGAPPAVAQ